MVVPDRQTGLPVRQGGRSRGHFLPALYFPAIFHKLRAHLGRGQISRMLAAKSDRGTSDAAS
jgi:hypothetical protein